MEEELLPVVFMHLSILSLWKHKTNQHSDICWNSHQFNNYLNPSKKNLGSSQEIQCMLKADCPKGDTQRSIQLNLSSLRLINIVLVENGHKKDIILNHLVC